ncbi:hypothetical protein C2845_PM03G20110 [Panicum miliaceum]|uniref:Uncharacterized protein n=1 Tax=Panicum miliaceum TaxID=4540 RepID=A0A3L6T8C3_PANMI|nr:hypothetical protein C2845_PM03G20110 [Panicum miliaceum]
MYFNFFFFFSSREKQTIYTFFFIDLLRLREAIIYSIVYNSINRGWHARKHACHASNNQHKYKTTTERAVLGTPHEQRLLTVVKKLSWPEPQLEVGFLAAAAGGRRRGLLRRRGGGPLLRAPAPVEHAIHQPVLLAAVVLGAATQQGRHVVAGRPPLQQLQLQAQRHGGGSWLHLAGARRRRR